MADELRAMIRQAAVEHNATVLQDADSIENVRLADLVDVDGVVARYDAGQPIADPKDKP